MRDDGIESDVGVLGMTAVRDQEPRVEAPEANDGALSRRALLSRIGLGAVTVVVAGAGVASYRVYDNGVLDAGSGEPFHR